MIMAWKAHKVAVNCLSIVGHHNDILSCSEDQAIYLWEIKTGVLKGILTYGQNVDRYITPKWKSMVDKCILEELRKENAREYIQDLSLQHVDPKVANKVMTLASLRSSKIVMGYKKPVKADFYRMNDRDRVMGQLVGNVTYQLSDKDIALAARDETAKLMSTSMKVRDFRIRKKKSLKVSDRYFESCSMPTDFVSIAPKQYPPSKPKRQLSAYDFELLQVQNSDPHNWEITSKNRQQAMYSNLYEEYSKGGRSGPDQYKVLEAKANALSPEGNFQSFYSSIVESRVNINSNGK